MSEPSTGGVRGELLTKSRSEAGREVPRVFSSVGSKSVEILWWSKTLE